MHLQENVYPARSEPHEYLTTPLSQSWRSRWRSSEQEQFLKLLELRPGPASTAGGPRLDLRKLADFFAGTGFLERITKTRTAGGPKTTEAISEAFVAYCGQVKARKVRYQYNSHTTPFDDNFQGESNCKGRGRGFLQLMALMGVELNRLALIVLDGLEESKIAKLDDRSIHSESVFCAPNTRSEAANNAVIARLENGKLKFSRTDREPFANHYAARVSIDGVDFRCWDPLFNRSYKNGMADYFETYKKTAHLSAFGLDCYAAPQRPRRRLYRLPAQSNAIMSRDAAFQTALNELGQLEPMPRLYVIIDEDDWGAESDKHPAVVRHIMRTLEAMLPRA